MSTTPSAWLTALVLGLVLVTGCTLEAAGDPTDDRSASHAALLSTEVEATRALRVNQPVTLRLAPSDALLSFIRALEPDSSEPPFLQLTLRELERPDAELSVRVFVNTPADSPALSTEALSTKALSTEELGYAGNVGFFPATSAAPGAEALPDSTFLLNIGPLLAALPAQRRIVDDRFVDITLVAVPLRDTPGLQSLDDSEIAFKGVRLSSDAAGHAR